MAHVIVICAACREVIVRCTEAGASVAHESVCTKCEERGFYMRSGQLRRDESAPENR